MMSIDDCLEPETGVLAPGSSLAYQLAVRRILLPDSARLLQVVSLPSFGPERALYVCAGSSPHRRVAPSPPTIVTGRPVIQIWEAGMRRAMEAPVERGPRVARPPTDADFGDLAPEVDWARAPLRGDVLVRLRALWDAVLSTVRVRDTNPVALDGVTHHFATPLRGGLVRNPVVGSVGAALVDLADSLEALARTSEASARVEREDALAKTADQVLARIREGCEG